MKEKYFQYQVVLREESDFGLLLGHTQRDSTAAQATLIDVFW